MATYYVDFVNGNDGNAGTSWGTAWATISKATSANGVVNADTIRVAKSPAPVNIGTATWTAGLSTGPLPGTIPVTAATNANPIQITVTGNLSTLGWSSGDVVQIKSVGGNTNANGIYRISIISTGASSTFTLYDGYGNNVTGNANYTSGGTAQRITPKCVLLPSAQTQAIADGESTTAWTSAAGTATRVGIATDAKFGDGCIQVALSAGPATNTLQAYYTLPATLNLSAYQRITFWIKPSVTTGATNWRVCLCSDTLGQTPVEDFAVPAITQGSTANWVPISITKTVGGVPTNLSSSVKSIAVYTGATTATASSNIRLDNIQATTTTGINLQSLISRNSAEKGGTEPWYCIQGIYGTIVLLDAGTNTLSGGGPVYGGFGSTGTVSTYIRETIKLTMVSTISSTIQQWNAGGTLSGGWNISSGLQDGETILDGQNGYGYVLLDGSRTDSRTMSYIGAVRGYYGLYLLSAGRLTVDNCRVAGNSSPGIALSSCYLTTVSNTCSAGNSIYGIYVSGGGNQQLITSCLSTGSPNPLYTTQTTSLTLSSCYLTQGSSFGINAGSTSGFALIDCVTSGNQLVMSTAWLPASYGRNCTFNETSLVAFSANFNGVFPVHNLNGVLGNHYVFMEGGSANAQTSTVHTAGGVAWKMTLSATNRDSLSPLSLPLARVACAANVAVTVSAWVKKDAASNNVAALVCRGGQIAGVTNNVITLAADSTDWQPVSITFTPSEAGVVQIEGWFYYTSSTTGSAYFDDISITQA